MTAAGDSWRISDTFSSGRRVPELIDYAPKPRSFTDNGRYFRDCGQI